MFRQLIMQEFEWTNSKKVIYLILKFTFLKSKVRPAGDPEQHCIALRNQCRASIVSWKFLLIETRMSRLTKIYKSPLWYCLTPVSASLAASAYAFYCFIVNILHID